MKKPCLFSVSLVLVLSVSVSASTIGELTLQPRAALPGQSVQMRVHVVTGDAPVHLAPIIRVRVIPAIGEPYIAEWASGVDHGLIDTIDDQQLAIAPHSTTDLFVEPRVFGRRSWTTDYRLSTPGMYRLQVLLYDDEDTAVVIGESSVARFEVSTPTGADAEIARHIASGTVDQALAELVLRDSSYSSYMPYLMGFVFRDTAEKRIEVSQRILSLHPNSPLATQLRLYVAKLYDSESRSVFAVNHDLDRASALAEKERSILDEMTRSSDEWGRRKARQILDEGIPSRAGFIRTR